MQRKRGDRHPPGLTVIELAVGVAMVAILAAVATPSLLGMLQVQRLNAGALQVTSDIRKARALAVATQIFHRWHSGTDSAVNLQNNYRIEKATTSDGKNWPAKTDGPGGNVVTTWIDLPTAYAGLGIGSVKDSGGTDVGWVIFNSRGVSVDPWTGNLRGVTIVVTGTSGTSRTIQISKTGGVILQ